MQPGELKDKLFIINEEDGGLSDEHITSLRRYDGVPTISDLHSLLTVSQLKPRVERLCVPVRDRFIQGTGTTSSLGSFMEVHGGKDA